ncbi:MAG: NAD-dependent epimerase/dehydratase family protein, partial [Rhodospirillales bacterium]|nr:NAD-dependent epimerase/dehydratase family protein [Rhodospirillales bacterium]
MLNPVLVTGAAGFIGSTLCQRLLDEGRSVIGIDNFNEYYDSRRKRANIRPLLDDRRFTLCETDICDRDAMLDIFDEYDPEAVAHLGAYGGVRYSIKRAELYTQANIVGSVNVLDAARDAKCKTFVFASTSSVYGHTTQLPFIETDPCNLPLAPYPASKKAIELMGYTYHNLHGLDFTALRFFSVYGPRARPDMMPFMVTDRVHRGETITLFNAGQMKRDWTFVDDIVQGVALAVDKPLGYEVINLGRGEPVLMADFVTIIEGLIGKKAVLETPDAPPSEPAITYASVD